MEPSFWLEKWQQDQIGFHADAVHDDLIQHGGWLLDGGPHRILVPLCGKSRDVHHLSGLGHAVAGVELSDKALRAMHDEQGIGYTARAVGPYAVLDSQRAGSPGGAHLLGGDLFDLRAEHLTATLGARPDRLWDRAALVALHPDQRSRYIETLRGVLAPGARLLLNVLHYDPAVMDGPPWSVSPEEVAALWAGAEIEHIDQTNLVTAEPRWAERGHRWFHRDLYQVQLPE
jgi:thiopurine S-methyltransferase